MSDFEPITKNVTGLQFSIMSPEEIRKRSVVEITKHETYDKDVPVIKGLFDSRMGTTDMGKVCNTCGLDNMGCPGHFGHIELAKPVYNYHFIDIVIKILKCLVLILYGPVQNGCFVQFYQFHRQRLDLVLLKKTGNAVKTI